MKKCATCNVVKNSNEFYKRADRNYERSSCKNCNSIKHKEYYKKNSSTLIAYSKKWREENPEKAKIKHFKPYVFDNKLCSKCKVNKTVDQFIKRHDRNYYYSQCRDCMYKANRERRKTDAHKQYFSLYMQNYRKINPEYVQRGQVKYWSLKSKVFNGYGNCCKCCGETEKDFLEIDHVNNDGKNDPYRKNLAKLMQFIINNNFPKNYQLLCSNCNQSKRKHGQCMHKIKEVNCAA